jgi:hypothetical protein
MNEVEIVDYARRLFEAHGDKAEAEAAQREVEARKKSDETEARDWARIRLAIHEMRKQ